MASYILLIQLCDFMLNALLLKLRLHEKSYFPCPGMSWKAKKVQVNIIFQLTFWLKKRPYFSSPKNLK